jgi:two-component system sensor histidine kinase/response regulator
MKEDAKTRETPMKELKSLRKQLKEHESKASASSLKLRENFYKDILDSIDDLIFVKDENHRWVFLNNAACKAWGYKKEELIGKMDYDIFPKKEADIYWEKDNEILKNEKTILNEEPQTIAGSVHTIATKKSIYKDKNTRKKYIVGTIRDITEHKRIENLLRESEEKFRNLFDNISSGVAVYEAVDGGKDFIFKEFNKASERIEKIKKEKVLRKSVLDVFPGVKKFGLFSIFKRVYRTGKPELLPISLYRDNRISGWRENYVYKLPSGEIVAVYDDVTEKIQAEEALVKERNLLRTLIDNIPDLIYVKDRHSRYLINNIATIHILGAKSENELIGKRDLDTLPKDLASKYYQDDQKVVRTGKAIIDREEKVLDKSTGKTKWVSTYKAPLRDTDGKIIGIVGVSRDITEHKHIQDELKKSEERYALAQSVANVGSWDWNIETDDLFWSEQTEKIYGISRGEFSRKYNNFLELVHPDDREKVRNKVKECLESGIEYQSDYRIVRTDGTIRWTWSKGKVIRNNDGNPIRMIGITHDITEQKIAEERLSFERDLLETLMDNIPDMIYFKDPESRFTRINQAQARVLGLKDQDEAIGKSDADFFTNKHASDAFEDEQRIMRTKTPLINKLEEIRRSDGQFRWVSSTKVPIVDKEGNVSGLVGISRDVTDLKETENRLQEAKQAAESASRAKSTFLANMSHEIRTPMNAIIGFTDMLLDTTLDEDQTDYAGLIKISSNALLYLMNDILDFSKIEAGEVTFEKIDFDPELLVYDVCELIRPRIGSKPIEIICHLGEDIPSYVSGDPTRFRQVLLNLMTNASKFTESGEIEIELTLEKEEKDRIKFHIRVRDTGIGIAKNKLPKIFEAFHQADDSMTRRYGGTGLGLSISRNIIKKMGGDIWVDSKVGKGSIFHFTAWFEKTADKHIKKITPISLKGKRALIVDDNKNNLKILKHILQTVGMEVTALQNGSEVLSTLKNAKHPYDICITDLQMPDISGYQLAEQIRKWKHKGTDIALIALSSLSVKDAKQCEDVGFDGFLSKPIRREKLYQMLERILGAKGDESAKEKKRKMATQYSVREDLKHSIQILLAEDNPVNQKLAKLMLSKAGYQVTVADNGKEAFKKYCKAPGVYDLIFMDVQMPELDGFEVTREIRKKGFKDVPIVAMTAHAMKGDRERCLEAGMNDYITKPIKRELVLELIEKWIFKKEAV